MKCITIVALAALSALITASGYGNCGSMPSCAGQIKKATVAYHHCVERVFIEHQTQCEVDYEKIQAAVLAEIVAEKASAIFSEFQVTSCGQLTNAQIKSIGGCQDPDCSL